MRFSIVDPSELDGAQRADWLARQRTNPLLASPFFSPELTHAVSLVRRDVRVAVMEDERGVVGYFPFQRERFGAGHPLAAGLSDHHGVIAAPDATWNVGDLLRACGLAFWEFDHLVAKQVAFSSFHQRLASSPALDLSGGYAAYRKARTLAGSGRISQLERKARKLEREVGPLRFEAHVEDRSVLSFVFEKKSEQCRRTKAMDFFSLSWTRELVDHVLSIQKDHFAGMLAALYAGDRLVAAHMGMRSERVMHWWFPVYAHDFADYSPGAILLLKVAEDAARRGLTMLDLGKGQDAYKASFANLDVMVAEGCASVPSARTSLHDLRRTGERWLRTSRLVQPLRPALGFFRRCALRTT
jgi:CelD/BcsL family acetyltransferase involved in cellulose biosynthesis